MHRLSLASPYNKLCSVPGRNDVARRPFSLRHCVNGCSKNAWNMIPSIPITKNILRALSLSRTSNWSSMQKSNKFESVANTILQKKDPMATNRMTASRLRMDMSLTGRIMALMIHRPVVIASSSSSKHCTWWFRPTASSGNVSHIPKPPTRTQWR